jgi:predicted DNA binding CopG/RHH family protein
MKKKKIEIEVIDDEELNAFGCHYDSIAGTEAEKSEWSDKTYTLEELGCSNGFEAGRKILAMKSAKKKSESIISIQLPKPLIATIKRRAKSFSIPWPSYIREVLEIGVRQPVK